MPIYEYQCTACQHKMEVLQKISDLPKTECPVCHQDSLKKQISAAGFRLKGQGWYETDFKKGSKKNLAGSQDSTSAATTTTTKSKTGTDTPAK